MIRYQRTIRNTVSCSGTGLHSGTPVQLRMKPAPVDTGIVFIRTDLGGRQILTAAANTGDTSYATTLGQNGVIVRTVEHVLSACAGLNIDNVFIEIDAEEVPIMDGSAGPFIRLIAEAGVQNQEKCQPMIKIIRPIFVRVGNKQVAIWPAEATSISYFIDFSHPLLKEQSLQYVPAEESYLREIADARTFGFVNDVQALQANGLARGASLENAVALGKDSVLNKEGLRYKDEFVRHKILDLIGDFSLVGMPVIGHIVAHKSGHALNAQMVKRILNSPQNWVIVGVPDATAALQQEMQYQHATL
ncbi:MAG TPA: UDP-3-O-acyl-N-acetylglucosamine deacetylase [Nitrospirota bacterium]|nr:UDP-3-O-acyl-N-acetylglucosamine deacetylase [Nitrospirota bacterium]